MTQDNILKIKPFLDRILEQARVHAEASNKNSIEGNAFEFGVCDLLLKGAGAAMSIYIALINIPSVNMKFYPEAFVYLSASMIIGISHKLNWSTVLLDRGKKELKVYTQIMLDVNQAVKNGEQGIMDLWQKISEQEINYFGSFSTDKKDDKTYKYLVPFASHEPYRIYFQFIFIICAGFGMMGSSIINLSIPYLVHFFP